MSSNIERWEPPNDATAFESLCLDLWKDIWQDSGAQKHGRRGQKQDGVDIFGHEKDALVGVQCKQKDGRLWARVTKAELEAEVEAARRFKPKLARFILATTAPRDAALQRKANELTEQHRQQKLFSVEVWAWEDIWHELYRRYDLLGHIAHNYWPRLATLPPRPPSLADLVRDVRPYLEYIAPLCQRLPLIGLDPKAKDTPLTLDAVYTSLDTKTSERAEEMPGSGGEEAKPLPALQAVARHSCVVLKGDPGSGKSTFVSHLSLCLAKHHLEPDKKWLERLEGWPADACPLPLTIVLRDFVRAQPPTLPDPHLTCLWEFFVKTLKDTDLETCASPLKAALNLGHAIVFLDGLDEVPTDAQRDFVRACALKFAERFRHSRLVLTCRTIPYQAMLEKEGKDLEAHPRPGPRLADVPDFELAPFDDEKISKFITAWYIAHVPKPFSREVAEERRRALAQAVQRPELRRLAGNPMLLTDMALLDTHRGRLPNDRAKLYKEVIELLLLRWDETKSGGGLQDLLREAKRDDNDLLRTLGAVAYAVHSRSRNLKADETGDIQRYELLDAFEALHPEKSLDWAKRVIETIEQRAGLLVAREERVFAFRHRSFQEYLAAVHLTKDKDFAGKALSLLDETGYWREVIKWASGRVTHVDDVVEWKGFALLRKLCPGDQPPEPLPWHRVWLAGEALLEMSLAKVTQFDDGPALVIRSRGLLKQLVAQGALTPFERAQAGMALGQLGDDRPGVGTIPRPSQKAVPDLDWAGVIEPGDPFTMGGKTPRQDNLQFKHRLQHPFCVALYPVTVAQFALFIQDGGYEREALWTRAGWQWREKEQRTPPEDYEPAFQTPNHPRVGVTWYEAMAFCNWINVAFTPEELKLPDKTWTLRLPSEAEWERAARHTDGRSYPWGDEAQVVEQRSNIGDTGLGHTSAVGLFPSGNAACGAADVAGNVWEWCLTQWREDYKNYEKLADQGQEGDSARVLRGGSWSVPADNACCAFRVRGDPVIQYWGVGFRLVASPFFALDSDSSELRDSDPLFSWGFGGEAPDAVFSNRREHRGVSAAFAVPVGGGCGQGWPCADPPYYRGKHG
jgi:formylglycine-generating enzyme required for sulfatase activity